MLQKNKLGFSLVELLVVMAIMMTLGGVGYQAMSGNKVTARDTARTEALTNLQSALDAYYSKNNFYPQPAIRYSADGVTGQEDTDISDVRNAWGFIPDEDAEALASCKFAWNSELNEIDRDLVASDYACGGLVKDRSNTIVVGWKGTLTEFSGKNSIAKKEDGEYINPLTDREDIAVPFDKTYFDEIPKDPSLGNIESLQELGIGYYIYSAYRKGIDEEGDIQKNTNIGASQYQLAATMENSEEPTDATAYVIGNYIRKSKAYKTKVSGGRPDDINTFLPYSLIGSKNKVIMNGQLIDDVPSFESCPESDKYSSDHGLPCSDEGLDGTSLDSDYKGIPYSVVF